MSGSAQAKLQQAIAVLANSRKDEGAWSDVYSALAPRAAATAYRYLGGNRAQLQDICQEAFLHLFRAADFKKLTNSDELSRYFAVIVRNVCLDALQHRSRDNLHFEPYPDSYEADVGYRATPWQQERAASTELVELEQELDQVMSFVAPPERILLSLLRKGYSLGEVAARLGVSYENAGVRVHRLRAKLREWRLGKADPARRP